MEKKLPLGQSSLKKWDLSYAKTFSLRSFFFKWEWLLIVILMGIMAMNSVLSPHFLNANTLIDSTRVFLDNSFIVFPMVLIILMGDIDISVGSIVALSSVVMGMAYRAGAPMAVAMAICLLVGTVCGLINGLLLTKFKELSAVIVTLGTMITFRGIAYMLLENQAIGNFPVWFSFFGWDYVAGVPFILIAFLVTATIFILVLHKTSFGRQIYAIGRNSTASRFSGLDVDKVKIIVFMLAGLMAAVTAIFLTSRMGSTRPNIASNYELQVIAMVALGGVSTSGAKGRMFGPIIAVFIIGYLQFGLGLVNIPAQTLMIIIGLLLIVSVAVTRLKTSRK